MANDRQWRRIERVLHAHYMWRTSGASLWRDVVRMLGGVPSPDPKAYNPKPAEFEHAVRQRGINAREAFIKRGGRIMDSGDGKLAKTRRAA